jgi:4-amino-4-deoxy-L-arabinose transferase-like glycosyltransferase
MATSGSSAAKQRSVAAPDSPALFDQFARGWRAYALVALIALASALFGAGAMPPLDADEAQFALSTRQMVESGVHPSDALAVHVAQAATLGLLHARLDDIAPYRLPSALGSALAAIACLWAGQALIGQRSALIGAGLFAAGLFAGFEGMCATPVALLLGFTTLAFAALAHLASAEPQRTRLVGAIFWAAIACAFSIDALAGITVVLGLGCLVIWERRAGWLRPLLWWPALLVAVLIVAANLTLGGHVASSIHILNRHLQLPGYHMLLLPLLLFPATYALPAAVRLVIEAVRTPATQPAPFRFLIAWAGAVFFFAEFWPTKLPTYALPAYPAIALMCGAGMAAMLGRRWRSAHPAGLVLFGVAGLVLVVLIGATATFMPGDFGTDVRRAISAGLIGALIVAGALAGLLFWRRATTRAAVLIAAALALSYSLREHILPDAREFNVSGETVAELRRARLTPREGRALWVVGYPQASIVLLTRSSTRLARADEAGARARLGDSLVVEIRQLDALQTALAARHLTFASTDVPVRGVALHNGRRVALSVGSVSALADAQPQNPARQPTRPTRAPR